VRLAPEFGPQAALFAIEPQSRLVRAVVGGDDFYLHPFDRSRLARRQPGSTFKTFVYGAALESGVATADTEVIDARRTHLSHGRPWTPRNYGGEYDDKKHTLRDALARSINSIAVEIAERVSPAKVAEFATRMGIRSPLSADLPLALGASAVNPAELANAYATIAAGGMYAEPIYVTRVVDRFGRELFSAGGRNERVLSEKVALALTDMLGEVVRRGSGRRARVGRPVAGKTGTSNRGRDAWFTGFSPRLCAAVWVGYDDRKPMANASGSKLALPIWAQFMRTALDRVPVLPLPRLPHVVAAVHAPAEALSADPEAGADTLDDGRLEPAPDPDAPPPIEGEVIDESALDKL
jgi:penicillin-binding protein 1A